MKKILSALTVSMALSASVYAAPTSNSIYLDMSVLDVRLSGDLGSKDNYEREEGGKVLVGAQLTSELALEFGVMSISGVEKFSSSDSLNDWKLETDLDSYIVGLKADLPLQDRVRAWGRAGMMFYETESKLMITQYGGDSISGIGIGTLAEDGEAFYAGVGLDFYLSDTSKIVLEYNAFNDDNWFRYSDAEGGLHGDYIGIGFGVLF